MDTLACGWGTAFPSLEDVFFGKRGCHGFACAGFHPTCQGGEALTDLAEVLAQEGVWNSADVGKEAETEARQLVASGAAEPGNGIERDASEAFLELRLLDVLGLAVVEQANEGFRAVAGGSEDDAGVANGDGMLEIEAELVGPGGKVAADQVLDGAEIQSGVTVVVDFPEGASGIAKRRQDATEARQLRCVRGQDLG